MTMKIPEPRGYFRKLPLGWVDCSETAKGSMPLYDKDAVVNLIEINETLIELVKHTLKYKVETKDDKGNTEFILHPDSLHDMESILRELGNQAYVS